MRVQAFLLEMTSDIWPFSTSKVVKLEHGPCNWPLAALSKSLITLHIASSVSHHPEHIVTISTRLTVLFTVTYQLRGSIEILI